MQQLRRSELVQMVRDRHAAADEIAENLFNFEVALDAAIAAAGRLTSSIPEARMKAKVSAVAGQDAMGRIGDALASLHAARASAVVAHHEFATLYQQMFRKTFASGDLWKFATPSASAASDGPVALTLVQDRAA
jgi:hypothetical protein